jgi:hypothetical protein
MHRPFGRGLRPALLLIALLVTPIPVGARARARSDPPPPTHLRLVTRQAGRALLEWDAVTTNGEIRGYKIRPSSCPGAHPDPESWPDGRLAAFTWTTDDGFDDNLLYAPSFESRGLAYTAFVNSGRIGVSGKLSWSDLQTLHLAGHEIANHTRDHVALIDDRALAIRYVGPGGCTLRVSQDSLITRLGGWEIDLAVALEDEGVDHLVELVDWVDSRPNYEATLLYSDLEIHATQSCFLDPVVDVPIEGAVPETLTTERGVHDDLELCAQVEQGAAEIEACLRQVDPDYACRTLAYPNHAHRQRTMSCLNELGCLGARSGGPGEQPFFSEGSFVLGFNTSFEVPLSSPRPSNSWTEEYTRQKYRDRLTAWKSGHVWAVLMAHSEEESDAQHVEWMIDEIAADPDVWIAPFGEVLRFLRSYYLDVGNPVDESVTTVRAWIDGLDDDRSTWVVVTDYDTDLAESPWSNEILIPPPSTGAALPTAPAGSPVAEVLAAPNPFRSGTSFRVRGAPPGRLEWEVIDVGGRRVRSAADGSLEAAVETIRWDGRDGGGRPVPAGVYFIRIRVGDASLPPVKVVRTGRPRP